ncbi:hypothetical protein Dred_1026 [Desulforamulus reducens MI-1]|uniref:Prepilin-type N-terminal cleavage/methylation domain-containing protein n=1 Tax=Desulforamulus reducens (strain ATCC BAA-1160 / DSM 100696 / MI-1) TaxID=349161 RepID=A4J3A8_DESRM|nr:prepilin-type N-terminal cleavage/methylation domain-containing protein [Desulforamulus reducens]ABO49561.1 hypothetical protein Dred_1026 [Desulforamulus reducens MI-1]
MSGGKITGQSKGFTFIEVLAAMSILMIVLLPITTILFQTKRFNMENERKLKARQLAQAKIEEIKAMDWQKFKGDFLLEPSYATSEEPASFGSEYRDEKYLADNDINPRNDFTYRVRLWPTEYSYLYTVQVTVYYQEAGKEKWQTLYTEKLRR